MDAIIYKPGKTAMQSGHANTAEWVLEFDAKPNRRPEPLMGWTASDSTLPQVRLEFASLEDAQAYALKNGLNVSVLPLRQRKVKPRNYTDNFRYRPEDEA